MPFSYSARLVRTLALKMRQDSQTYLCTIVILLILISLVLFYKPSAKKRVTGSSGTQYLRGQLISVETSEKLKNGYSTEVRSSIHGETLQPQKNSDATENQVVRPRESQRTVISGEICDNKDGDFERWICNNEHDFDRLSRRLSKTKVTGHIFMRDSVTLELTKKPELKSLYEYVQQNMKHATTFCETGFNGGHSSMMWAKLFHGKVDIISFDMCNNNGGCDIGLEEIHKLYPDVQHTLIRGDSTVNLPDFTKKNPDVKCDVLFIDGGHNDDVPEKDLYNFKAMAKDNHMIIMDDCVWNTTSGYTNWIGKAINKGVTDKLINPITCNPMYLPKMKRNHAVCFHKYNL